MINNTIKLPWYSLRNVVAVDDTALAAFGFTDWPSSNIFSLNDAKMKDVAGILISGYGSDAADEDMTYKLYGRRKMLGPITLLVSGVMTLGTQVCAVDPITGSTLTNTKWVDTITATAGVLSDEVTVLDSGNNRQAILQVDAYGWQDLFLEVDLDGGATTMATFGAIISGVN